jgi:hypothetical protein
LGWFPTFIKIKQGIKASVIPQKDICSDKHCFLAPSQWWRTAYSSFTVVENCSHLLHSGGELLTAPSQWWRTAHTSFTVVELELLTSA